MAHLYLHPTMYLLIQGKEPKPVEKYQNLHPTMYLLIRNAY